MSKLCISIAFLLIAGFLLAAADGPGRVIDNVEPVVVAAFISQTAESPESLDRIARCLSIELELKAPMPPIKLKLYSGKTPAEKTILADPDARYLVNIEILKREWRVINYFQIPYIFFVYRNNYYVQAIFKAYHKGDTTPVIIKKYDIKQAGPSVMQLFENNPEDGGLALPFGRRLALEQAAEDKFVHELSYDLYQTIKSQGD